MFLKALIKDSELLRAVVEQEKQVIEIAKEVSVSKQRTAKKSFPFSNFQVRVKQTTRQAFLYLLKFLLARDSWL